MAQIYHLLAVTHCSRAFLLVCTLLLLLQESLELCKHSNVSFLQRLPLHLPSLIDNFAAGSPLSHPNTATAHMASDQSWFPQDSHANTPGSLDGGSPIAPAAAALCVCDSPTSVLWHSAGEQGFYVPSACTAVGDMQLTTEGCSLQALLLSKFAEITSCCTCLAN